MKELIDTIIEDLIDESSNLESTILKCQVLSYKLQNDQLKNWVNKEINGYNVDDVIPEYRCVKTMIKGHMFMDLGYGGYKQLPDTVLPIQYLEEEYQRNITRQKFTERISQLYEFAKSDDGLIAEMPHSFLQKISQFTGEFEVIKARKIISPGSVAGIISSIKSKLLTLLLELKEEIGDNEIPPMKKKEKINQLIEKTIGNIKAENVNISIGDKNTQTSTAGKQNISQSITGDNNSVNLNTQDLTNLIQQIKDTIKESQIDPESRDELNGEIIRIEKQVSKEKPSTIVIGQSLKVIYDLMTEVVGSAISEPTLTAVGNMIKSIG